jgi:8-oxo-dGTP pyrophosphatase MutT (NUDIX family)
MKKRIRPGIAAVIFAKIHGKKKFLVLKRKMYWTGWEWVKGGRKKGETEIQCLHREVYEETGKKPEEYILKKTHYVLTFLYPRPFVHDFQLWDGMKTRVYALELLNNNIRLDNNEHSTYKWVNKHDAVKMLTHEDQRKVFKKVA